MRSHTIPREGLAHPILESIPEDRVLDMVLGFAEPLTPQAAEMLQATVNQWAEDLQRASEGQTQFRIGFNGQALSVALFGVERPHPHLDALVQAVTKAGLAFAEIVYGLQEVDADGDPGSFVEDPRIDLGSDSFGELVTPQDRADAVTVKAASASSDDDDEDDEDDEDNDAKMLAFWRASFDATRPAPPFLDPQGMFSVLTLNDGGMVTERRSLLPYAPKLRVGYGLVNVDDRPAEDRDRQVSDGIRRAFEGSFPAGARPPLLNAAGEEDGTCDCISAYGRRGWRFAVDREAMLALYPFDFRYREYELLAGLADAIAALGLAPVIHWDRGGVYLINLWEAGSDAAAA
ncbi:MAG: hypothetical protein HOO96_34945 [Polyangiaceae bacterium]|nr:hypothetical protein [Polyangiaceae bacterium]